jgi:ATP-dependent Lon protease
MTGEITLRGSVLPIGGLTEKAVAARRSGIRTLIIPAGNRKDLVEIPKEILKGLKVIPVEHMDEVLEHTLLKTDKSPDFRQTRNITTH